MKQLTKITLLFCIYFLTTNNCTASFWENLWNRRDEQAMQLLQKGKAQQAAQRFVNPEWQAIAQYRAGNYEQAANALKSLPSARSYYNQGNALAHLGQYEAAITAYDESLKLDSRNEDAVFNRDLLKKLMQQQKQQSQQNQQNQQNRLNKEQQRSKKENKEQQAPQENKNANNNKQKNRKDDNKSSQEKSQTSQHQQPASKRNVEDEKNQEAKQWLSRIPENPGGLLREKFLRNYQRRHMGTVDGE